MGRSRVNLKVQTGCDEWCTFCIIPSTRGPLRSYPCSELLAQARSKVAQGARELVLTGVHLGKYGWDEGRPDDALLELLEGLLAIDGLARIRLSSILARHVTPRLVDLIGSEPRLCRFLHIPLQAGDDEVLEHMHRPYRIVEYGRTIELVRTRIPGIALATDVIVGFPGETPAQFERTLDVVRRAGFLKLHVFRYSPRPGTPSAAWAGQVPEEEKRRRSKELIAVGNELRLAVHQRQLGRSREVLVEERFDNGDLVGHTDDFVRVRFPGSVSLVDRLARVHIGEAGLESVRGSGAAEVAWDDADPRDLRLTEPPARPA
ncbi:MAG: MiaB/RimO family radical SAM methylthiotransferase [Actinomycetota bacterium]